MDWFGITTSIISIVCDVVIIVCLMKLIKEKKQ